MQVHHVRHWSDGGRTDRANLLLLCQHHHNAAHHGRWTVILERPGQISVRQRAPGGPFYESRHPKPPPRVGPDPRQKLLLAAERARRGGVA